MTVSQAGNGIKQKRILEIDFWRGFALIVIVVDHVPRNGLGLLTPRNFGFSDAAEAFFFLSGASVSLAYASALGKGRVRRIVSRCTTRAAQLYLVHIALSLCSIAIPLAAAKAVGDEGVALEQGLSWFLSSPISSLVGVVTLRYLPNFSNILPLYVLLMLWAPVVLLLAWRSRVLAFVASVGVYAAGRGNFEFKFDGWWFNPLAWQLVFVLGVICALTWRDGLPRPKRGLVLLALAIILGAAILSVKAMGIRAAALAHLDLDKSELGIMRLAHFLALAYLLAAVTTIEPWAAHMRRVVGSDLGQSLQAMGRNSLLFYAVGSVASIGSRSLYFAARSFAVPDLTVHLIGLVYTIAAIGGMFALVRLIERTARPLARSIEIGDAVVAPMSDRTAPILQTKDSGLAPLLAPTVSPTRSPEG
jgi:hypothetical protein